MGRYDKKINAANGNVEPRLCPGCFASCFLRCSDTCTLSCTGTANMKSVSEKPSEK